MEYGNMDSGEVFRVRKLIQRLPESSLRACMLPLGKAGKVAFTPGRIVHTNEFFLPSAPLPSYSESETMNDGTEITVSNCDALRWIDCSFREMEEAPVYERDQGSGHTPLDVEISPRIIGNGANDKSRDTQHFRGASKQGEAVDGYGDGLKEDNEGEEGHGMEGVFEIREYIDENGTTVKQDVVNMSRQMDSLSQMLDRKKAEVDALPPGSARGKEEEKLRRQEDMLKTLCSGMVGDGAGMPSKTQGGNESTEFGHDEHLAFVRELSLLGPQTTGVGGSSLNSGRASRSAPRDSRDADEDTAEEAARARIRVKEQALGESVHSGVSGWKKGFLGKSSPPRVSGIASPGAKKVSDVPKTSPSIIQTEKMTSPRPTGMPPSQTVVPTAFSASVVEKQVAGPPPPLQIGARNGGRRSLGFGKRA